MRGVRPPSPPARGSPGPARTPRPEEAEQQPGRSAGFRRRGRPRTDPHTHPRRACISGLRDDALRTALRRRGPARLLPTPPLPEAGRAVSPTPNSEAKLRWAAREGPGEAPAGSREEAPASSRRKHREVWAEAPASRSARRREGETAGEIPFFHSSDETGHMNNPVNPL